jgi:cephalosporin hydroxylase
MAPECGPILLYYSGRDYIRLRLLRKGILMTDEAKVIVSWVFILALFSAGCRPSQKAEPSNEEIINRFNQIFYDSEVWLKTTWMGVLTAQNPCDPWAIQEIIYDIKPDVIIETGTWQGGSALYYAMLLDQINESGKVITVDIDNYCDQVAETFPVFKNKVIFLKGDSVSPKILKKIKKLVGVNKKVLVTLDSLHTKEHVLKELLLYSRFVSLGSYLIVQDTNIHGHPVFPSFPEGPMEALTDFLKTNDSFVIDPSRNKFLLTSHPQGYLKRIK